MSLVFDASRKLARLAEGKVVRVRRCQLVAAETFDGEVISISCLTHGVLSLASSPSKACLLRQRGSLPRAASRRWLDLLAREGLPSRIENELFWQLACSPEPAVRTEAACHPNCPHRVLEFLAGDWWWEVRAAVGANRRCPEKVSLLLATDPSNWVRRAVADNPFSSMKAVGFLAQDEDFGIRDAVAEHPRCPREALILLCHDAAWEIRRSIAKRTDAPPEALDLLARDPEHWVRFFVACNPATPRETRSMLESDPRPSVRSAARHWNSLAMSVSLRLALPPKGGVLYNGLSRSNAPNPFGAATDDRGADPD
jgi:hypothetical protein